MKMTGAQIFLKCLEREEVKHIFGYPGGVVLDIYDELTRTPQIRHILVRHEQAAVHAADGYARASSKVGVALVTSGPGATNTVTGIASAYLDSIPIVVFTGQVPTALIGNDAFQEVDIVGITRPCTKHNYLVKDINQLAYTIQEAFHIARSGRPGPVLVDLPKDVMQASIVPKFPEAIKIKSYNPTYHANPRQVKRALELMLSARRPVLYTGGGIILSDASEELSKFAHLLQIPVTSTLMGLGGFPGDDPLWMGMLGMHGTYCANMAVSKADLLVGIGARFDDRVTGKLSDFAPHAKIIHVDIDPSSISKNVQVDIPIVGDCRDTLQQFNDLLHEMPARDWTQIRGPWLETIAAWEQEHPLTYTWSDTDHQAPVCHRKALGVDQGGRLHYHGGGPESDVGRPVLQVQEAPQADDLRRPGGHGLRLPRGHGGAGGPTGGDSHRHRRGRQHPDEHPGADHRGGK